MEANPWRNGDPETINVAEVTKRVIDLVMQMSSAQRLALLMRLERGEVRRTRRRAYVGEMDFVLDDRAYKGVIQDLSQEGALVATCDIPRVGGQIIMTFRLPDGGDYVRMTGEVVRETEMEFAVRFQNRLNENLKKYDRQMFSGSDGENEPSGYR